MSSTIQLTKAQEPVLTAPVRLMIWFYGILSSLISGLLIRFWSYRKSVIVENLRHAFGSMSEEEENHMVRSYYKHLGDLLVEPFMIAKLRNSELGRVVNYQHTEVLERCFKENKSIVLMTSHYGNWENMITLPLVTKHKVMAPYSPVGNKWLNRKLMDLRAKYGAILVDKADWYKMVLKASKQEPIMYAMVADQRPVQPYKHHVNLFDKKTYVQLGAERIAQKTGSAVVYVDVEKTDRHSYTYSFQMISEDGSKEANNAITEKYYAKLEATIRREPEFWLWSHRRWKNAIDTEI